MPSPKALHMKNTPKWGTPEWVIEKARELLIHFHLDPASSEEFNRIVQALMIYTEQDNGLAPGNVWAGNVFVNPPGGLVTEFWDKLTSSFATGSVDKAFWVGFSVEQLCTLADRPYHPMDFSTVILRKRLAFLRESPIIEPSDPSHPEALIDGEGQWYRKTGIKIVPGPSPSHGNYLTALGCDPAEFERVFGDYGKIYHGKLAGSR